MNRYSKRIDSLQGFRMLLFLFIFVSHTGMFAGMKETAAFEHLFGWGGGNGNMRFLRAVRVYSRHTW